MASKEPIKRICGACGHQWMSAPPMKAPSKLLVESDITYLTLTPTFGRKHKTDLLKADYAAKLQASHTSNAAFDTCIKCGSTGVVTTELSPAQIATQELSQRLKRRLNIAVLTLGISEMIRAFVWFRNRKSSASE